MAYGVNALYTIFYMVRLAGLHHHKQRNQFYWDSLGKTVIIIY